MLEKDYYKKVEVKGYLKYVLYSDTDSIFIAIPGQNPNDLPILQTDIQPQLDKYKNMFLSNQKKEKEKNPEYIVQNWEDAKQSFIKWITVEEVADRINDLIIKYTRDVLLSRCNIKPDHNHTFFKSELLMDNILSLDVKKNYAYKLLVKEGVLLDPPKIKYTGIQVVKSDATKITQQLLRNMIEKVALDDAIPKNEKNNKVTEIINYYKAEMTNDIDALKFERIGVPGKWGKSQAIINGMKVYNFIMGQDIFSPGIAGRYVLCKFLTPSQLVDIKSCLKSNVICIPYAYDVNELKIKLQEFNIEIDKANQWERIFTQTCKRVEKIIKQSCFII